ncbi:MAG: hypothetical protein AAF382_08460 [Pseudomonadota bacterium]
MTCRFLSQPLMIATLAAWLPSGLMAQTLDEVKSDVLSALATPLPITVIGPLLTRDVVVTEEGDGFRATLQDTTLMGLFPFGEVSLKLVAIDDDTYRVEDLQFPKDLDFPGMATVTLGDMTLNGTWSATDRSYSALQAEVSDLQVLPGNGAQGEISLGRLAFDVEKEPDDTDTESRFDILLEDVSATGLGGPDLSLGNVQALLSANGERPVDLYSLIREVMMVSMARDGGVGLQTLGESLLGNTYGSVGLDLEARELSLIDPQTPDESYFKAVGMQAELAMRDVNPRDWGMASLAVRLDQVEQQTVIDDSIFEVERAELVLSGADMPVGATFAAINTLDAAGAQPVLISDLLDGFLEFGALELSSEGEALSIEVREATIKDGERVQETAFVTGYDSWGAQIALSDFNENRGAFSMLVDAAGGTFTPGAEFDEDDLRHVNAWFPTALRYGGRVSNLNEGFLKQLFRDVVVEDLNEPVEVILPMVLYAAASVFDVTSEENLYATNLFSLEQSGNYRAFPAKAMSVLPIEGRVMTRMTGFDALVSYIEDIRLEAAAGGGSDADELSVVKSVLTVLRNLGDEAEDGSVTWDIEKADVNTSDITINGQTLYYPELTTLMPLLMLGVY